MDVDVPPGRVHGFASKLQVVEVAAEECQPAVEVRVLRLEGPCDIMHLPARILELVVLCWVQDHTKVFVVGLHQKHSDREAVNFGNWEATLHAVAGDLARRKLNAAEWPRFLLVDVAYGFLVLRRLN